MQATPVISPMVFTIKKERKIKNRPITAKTKVCLADSSFFASPPEVMYLMPAIIIKITATDPASISAQKIRVAIKGKTQLSVATCTPFTVVPQPAIII